MANKLVPILLFLVLSIASTCSVRVQARDSMFFSKLLPVRRYTQLVSVSKPAVAQALTPIDSVAVPSPAPAPSPADELDSENYVYGLYGQEVGEFPVGTSSKEAALTAAENVQKTNEARFSTQKSNNQGYETASNNRYNSYNSYDEYTNNNEDNVNNNYEYQRSYRNNDDLNSGNYGRRFNINKHNYKYTSNYNNNNEYTNENNYVDQYQRSDPSRSGGRRFVTKGRYYDDNSGSYYRNNVSTNNKFDSVEEEYDGVYQP